MRSELFRFEQETSGSSIITTYTSSNKEITFDTETYTPANISRGKIKSTSELKKAAIEVNLSLNDTLAQLWIRRFIDNIIKLTIYTKIDNGTPFVTWQGRYATFVTDGKFLKLTFETAFTSLRRVGLRKRFQRSCPYSLYSTGCNIDISNYSDIGLITERNGLILTIPAAATKEDGFYSGGIIEASSGAKRYIIKHVGSLITLSRDLFDLEYNDNIKLFAGCNRTRTDCNDKFNNISNFGGFPFIPIKNPFTGSSIA